MAKIKVLIIDDSALVRQILTEICNSDPGIEVVGVAQDPFDAREKIKKLNPDVLKDLLNTPEDVEVISLLNKFDSVLEQVINSNKPHLLCRWLIDLSQNFNTYYNRNKVIQDDKKLEIARLQLIASVKDHLKTGLELIGLKAPEEM